MTLEELNAALVAVDPAALLVPPRLLARVLRQVRGLPARFFRVPHRECFFLSRQLLFRHVEADELGLAADRRLPATVILLARPTPEQLRRWGREGTLLHFWRLLFHAGVHRLLEQGPAGPLTLATARDRIDQIGRVEFDEIRAVLEQEHYLFPGADDRDVYVEFAALYLELRFFRNYLRPVYFPGLRDFAHVDRVLAQDLDAAGLFAATRPAGVPDPVERPDRNADEPDEGYRRLVRRAERAERKGNTVLAAVYRIQAAGRAPAHLAQPTRDAALAGLRDLTLRLRAALGWDDDETRDWLAYLPALLEKTDLGPRTSEARLLYDLQKVCIDNEREIYALDVIEWALSAGGRPIKRPLPGQRLVRIALHLRSAARRLTTARLADDDRAQLQHLLEGARRESEARLQARFRPVLTDALHDVGLEPRNAPEQTAFHKMVEELLDRITSVGFLTFSDLRDVISRNDLKLPDIDRPDQFLGGDPVLRLDRRLATALDGVYRRGEFYLRWLERATSLGFGTRLGRALNLFVLFPFGGAVVLLEAVQLLVNHLAGPGAPVFGPLSLLGSMALPGSESGPAEPVLGTSIFLVMSLFLLGLIHLEPLRRGCKRLARKALHLGRKALIDLPARVLPLAAIRRVWESWPFQLFFWYFFKPLLLGGLVGWWTNSFLTGLVVFGSSMLVLDSRAGRSARAALARGLFRLYDWLKAGLMRNLFHFVVWFFKRLTDGVEYVIFSVDNWLRFRGGDSRLSLVFRAALGVVWFPVSYVARLYMVVLIEPGFNPLKAPVSIAAAKLIYPLTFALGLRELMARPLEPLLGVYVGGFIAWATWWLLPDAFGFLFWEMKENWRLYRANRPAQLRPVLVGPHGETMLRLLQPGFHSGTLPRFYARLRAAELAALDTGSWRVARGYRQALGEVEHGVRRFLERELLTLLRQGAPGQELPLALGAVDLASNQISFDLSHGDFPEAPLRIGLAERAGWLMAAILEPGWLGRLEPPAFRALVRAFGGLYKQAGVHLVRKQVEMALPAGAAFEVTGAGLAVWPDGAWSPPALYDLGAEGNQLRARFADGAPCDRLPALDAPRVIFARVAIPWEEWVRGWQEDLDGPADLPLREVFAVAAGQEGPAPVPREATLAVQAAPEVGRVPDGSDIVLKGSASMSPEQVP